jgi:mannose-6-phosphate isomerase-like protein (cupin superfamily)
MEQRTALLGAGNTITIAAGTVATGGVFALLDYELAPGFRGLPPHVHQREDEAAYVLEGQLLVRLGASEQLLGPGEFILLPRGIVHAQSNPGREPVRFLTLLIPAGFEQCLEDLDALLDDSPTLSPELTIPLLARYGVRSVDGTDV